MENLIPLEKIENKILLIRGEKVMLDSDLAVLYGVNTKRLNEQVKRNIKRFPDDFMFQLTEYETESLERNGFLRSQIATLKKENIKDSQSLRSQFATSKDKNGEYSENLKSQIATSSRGGRRYSPFVFSEQGIAMLSGVLFSDKAIEINIAIMRVFVNLRKYINSYEGLARQIAEIEKRYDKKIIEIFKILDYLIEENEVKKIEDEPRKEFGFM